MKFTPEEITRFREIAAKATPRPWFANIFSEKVIEISTMKHRGSAIIHWAGFDSSSFSYTKQMANARFIASAVNSHEAALNVIEQRREEIERLREALNDAGNAIAKVVACCTYGSEEQAKFGAYGISHEAFTLIDAFIRKHGDLLNTLEGGE